MTETRLAARSEAPPSEVVVEAIADAEGVAPEELDTALYDVVDPDALDQLFADTATTTRVHGHISFNYDDYRVFVDDEGRVDVDRRQN